MPFALEHHGMDGAVGIRDRLDRIDRLDEGDAFLERLDHLFVIETIGRRIHHALAVRDAHASPPAYERNEIRRAIGFLRGGALRTNRAAVHEKFVEQLQFLGVVGAAHTLVAEIRHERLIPLERFFHLQRVVGHQLGRRVDGRQSSTDHHGRKPRLQIREGTRV